jgi:hypothetical protein
MGLWSTIKGWFNIGGVQVLLWKYTEPLQLSAPQITGAVLFKTKTDKTVTGLKVKVIEIVTKTEKEGDEKKTVTETEDLGWVHFPTADPGVGYPLDLKAGVNGEQPFTVDVEIKSHLQNWGKVGKLASWATGTKVENFLIAEATVKGAAFAATARAKLTVAR